MSDEKLFEELARGMAAKSGMEPAAEAPAPPSLKARLYTALIREQQATGPLEPLTDTQRAGNGLCVFEKLVTIAPVGAAQPVFYCSVCHARVLAEHLDNPPIWWPHCPYAEFKNG
ncbi:MAG: hypothetical protein ABI972_14575 [Acidobacteriota bacterium]